MLGEEDTFLEGEGDDDDDDDDAVLSWFSLALAFNFFVQLKELLLDLGLDWAGDDATEILREDLSPVLALTVSEFVLNKVPLFRLVNDIHLLRFIIRSRAFVSSRIRRILSLVSKFAYDFLVSRRSLCK